MAETITLFRELRLKLRGGFLLRPLLLSFGLGITGALLSQLEVSAPFIHNWIPSVLLPSNSDPQIALSIINIVASSMMTVVAIVFSILLMTLSLASMQFSPRIIINFIEDKRTQNTLGIYLGTFAYCIAALPAVRTAPDLFVPVLTVSVALLLAFTCIGFLIVFINHISLAISANYIVANLARQTERMIDKLMPLTKDQKKVRQIAKENNFTNKTHVVSVVSGYIKYIDTSQLLSSAQRHQSNVQVIRRVGHFVPVGIPLFILTSEGKLTEECTEEFRVAFHIGPTRTLQQDVEFGILKIVDIALKALSPAVNDPSTAINCIDQLSAILIHFSSRDLPDGVMTDTDGKFFVSIPWLNFERLVDSAFEQIRMYSKTDVAVSTRIFRALIDIGHIVQDKHSRTVLANRGRRILAGCAKNFEEDEIIEMKNRMVVLEELAGGE